MAYLDGTVIPVPKSKRAEFIKHAEQMDHFFLEHGANRVVESWGANIAKGKTTDFRQAVDAKDDEDVVFSWISWPDKNTRDAAMKAMMEDQKMMDAPMPFDGKRMIYGGFLPIVEHGEDGRYVQGFVLPVKSDRKDDYRKMAEEAWTMFKDMGALSVVEAWQDDVPAGKQTDFFRSVKAEPGESIVFSYMTWPSEQVAMDAQKKMENNGGMKMSDNMPFDSKRMIWAGFEPVIELVH